MNLRSTIALSLLLLALAACGDPSTSPAAGGPTTTTLDPETPVSSTPGDHPGGQPHPRVVEPRPGMADVHPIPWQRVSAAADDTTLKVHFTSGVEPCYVLDSVDVKYQAKKVIVTLQEGHEPQDEDTACIDLAEFKVTEVALDEPLDGRKVVDGAR
jgi:hypothetical protein